MFDAHSLRVVKLFWTNWLSPCRDGCSDRNLRMLVHPNPGRVVWPAAMIVWGPGFTTAGHRQHSVQLIMALRGDLLIRSGARVEWMKCGAALVRPDAVHEVDAMNTS